MLSESSAADFEGSASEALEIGYLYCDLAEADGWDSVIQSLNERADEAAQADAEWMRLSALGLIADVRSLLCPDISTVDSSRSEGASLTEAEREQICADAPENGPLWRAAACDRG